MTNQIQYSPIDTRPEKELIPFCLQQDIQQLCYGTLAGGFFSSEWLEAEEPMQAFSNRSLTKYKLVIDDIGGWQHFQKILKALSEISKKHVFFYVFLGTSSHFHRTFHRTSRHHAASPPPRREPVAPPTKPPSQRFCAATPASQECVRRQAHITRIFAPPSPRH